MLRAGARWARASRSARPPSCRRTPRAGCSRCWTWASCRTRCGKQPVDGVEVDDKTHRSNGLFKLKGPKMLRGDHAPNFPLKHAQKDMRFALQLGDQVGTALPLAAAANAAYIAQRADHGDEDFSAVYEGQK